jgi:hypothetical protein
MASTMLASCMRGACRLATVDARLSQGAAAPGSDNWLMYTLLITTCEVYTLLLTTCEVSSWSALCFTHPEGVAMLIRRVVKHCQDATQ